MTGAGAAGGVFPRLRWSSTGVADRLVTAYPRVIHRLHPGAWGKEPWGRTQRLPRELPPWEARPFARQARRVNGSTGAPPQIVHSLRPPYPQPVLRFHPNFSTGLSASLGACREWAFCPQGSKSSGSMKSSRWIPGSPSRSLWDTCRGRYPARFSKNSLPRLGHELWMKVGHGSREDEASGGMDCGLGSGLGGVPCGGRTAT